MDRARVLDALLYAYALFQPAILNSESMFPDVFRPETCFITKFRIFSFSLDYLTKCTFCVIMILYQ